MALSCIWFRRVCSRHAVLCEPIPRGSRLERHLAGCAGCSAYWTELRVLASDLDRLVSVPLPAATCAEPIWDRVRPPARPHRRGGAVLATACACGLACGLAWWAIRSYERPEPTKVKLVKSGPSPFDEKMAAAPTPVPHEGIRENRAAPETIRVPREHHVKWARNTIHFRPERLVTRESRRSRPAPALDISDSPEALRASGQTFESQGDSGLANVAYQAEYQQHPSDEAAFDVGRSAEESGDMEHAMNAYAGLLDSAAARTQPEKGWKP